MYTTSNKIRKAKKEDLKNILEIYGYAREQMKQTGNPTQWGDSHPAKELLEEDIEKEILYVVENDGIVGVFAFIIGEDPTYQYIEGKWLNDKRYGTIHRVARGEKGKHVMHDVIAYCFTIIDHVRVDTHHDNRIMQHVLEKEGFTYCGVIYVADGSPRKAYQREKYAVS